jgi:hypothetical protein
MIENTTTASIGYDEATSIDMLELVGSERCLQILHVLNEVFDGLEVECETASTGESCKR